MKEADVASLKSLLGAGAVITDRVGLATYQGDAGLDLGLPDGVILPRTPEDVALIAKWASEHDMPLVARGAGTGLSGGAVAERGGLIIEFSRMNHVIELDEVGRSAVVEPGLVTLTFDEFVKDKRVVLSARPGQFPGLHPWRKPGRKFGRPALFQVRCDDQLCHRLARCAGRW